MEKTPFLQFGGIQEKTELNASVQLSLLEVVWIDF